MCDDRERLIGYVYDDCDAAERRVIEAHLSDCVVCREEVRGLRSTRQDLLAWEVPEPGPIWRPMASSTPARTVWQAMPAWAMAAAAGVILVIGAAGGAATYALFPRVPVESAQVEPATPARVSAQTVDIAALEQRLRELERSNAAMGELVHGLSNRSASPDASRVNVSTADLAQQIRILTDRQDELSRTMMTLGMETVGLKNRQVGLQQRDEMLVSLFQGQNTGGR